MTTKRRTRLIPRGGVECFEVRLVTSIDKTGALVTNVEVTTPNGTDYPALYEVLGAMRLSEYAIIHMYADDED